MKLKTLVAAKMIRRLTEDQSSEKRAAYANKREPLKGSTPKFSVKVSTFEIFVDWR